MMKTAVKNRVKNIFFEAPKAFKEKHRNLDVKTIDKLKDSLEKNYLDRGTTKAKHTAQEYNSAIQNQLHDRLYYNRNRIVPWLNKYKRLDGAHILEKLVTHLLDGAHFIERLATYIFDGAHMLERLAPHILDGAHIHKGLASHIF